MMIADKAVGIEYRMPGQASNNKEKTCHTKDKIFMSLPFRLYSIMMPSRGLGEIIIHFLKLY